MKPSIISKMLNTFIISGALAIVCFATFRHYFDAKTALFWGILIAFMLSVGIAFIASKRRKKFGLKQAELEHCQSVAKTLLLYPKLVVDEFFLNAIKKSCCSATLNNGWIETEKQQIFCMFETKRLECSLLAKILRSAPNKERQKVIFCIEYEPECSQMGAKLLAAPKVYSILKRSKTFPKVKTTALKKRRQLPHFFDRSNVLKYISLAVIFYFASMFVLYKNLYLFFAILSLLLAFFSLFAKKKTEEFVLE